MEAERFQCAPLRLVLSKTKNPCLPNVTYGCYPGESKFWVKDRCLGAFQCNGVKGRLVEWCGACRIGEGCSAALKNCSCIQAPLLRKGIAVQHPKPPRDDRLLETIRFTPCPDTSTCPPARQTSRVLVMQGAKEDAAFGNLFFSMVANFVLYAGHKGLVPLIHFEPSWVKRTMGTAWAADGGQLWEVFFEGYCPNVSAWLASCSNVMREQSKLKSFFYPGMQYKYKWPIHQWYNADSPAKDQCDETDTCDRFNAAVFQQWRLQGHAASRRVHRLSAPYQAEVDRLWHRLNPEGVRPVLGLHMRGSDKRSGRIVVRPEAFWPYVQLFGADFPRGLVYVATESAIYARAVELWNTTLGGRVLMQPIDTRVEGRKGNFYVHEPLKVAHDVLLDIMMLARCDYLLHGASAVAESAIYVNPALHWRSTHLEYAHSGCGNLDGRCPDAPWLWESTYHGPHYSAAPVLDEATREASESSSPTGNGS